MEVINEVLALDKEAKRSAELTKKLVLFGQQQFLRKQPLDLRESVARPAARDRPDSSAARPALPDGRVTPTSG